jgi:predicted dehydrogenase
MTAIPFVQVGLGNRGAEILADITTRHRERFRPVGFVDVEPSFVAAAQSAHPGVAAYGSLEEALAGQPEAAVVLVTPARLHGAMVRAALTADRHVWVEKPLTYDYAEAVGLADLARRRARSVVVGNQYRYHPLERQLARLVRGGRWGRAFHLSYIHHRHRPRMRAFGGPFPALWEQGVHSLDSILAILGDPALDTVYALGQKPPHSAYNGDTVTNVLTGFSNGVQAHLLVTFDSQRTDWAIRVECERAALLLVADGWERRRIEVVQGETVVDSIEPGPADDPSVADPIAAFHTAITTGSSVPTSIEVNLRTIQWIDAAVRSLESGEVVRLGGGSG